MNKKHLYTLFCSAILATAGLFAARANNRGNVSGTIYYFTGGTAHVALSGVIWCVFTTMQDSGNPAVIGGHNLYAPGEPGYVTLYLE